MAAILCGVLAFGATGVALALTGAGVPFLLAALLAAAVAGLVQYGAIRMQEAAAQPPASAPAESAEDVLRQQLDRYRTATGAMRHDLRGVLSPALMMSDRLLNHADPSVQRAGQAVVRSVERATALLADHREALAAPDPAPPAA